MLKSLFQILLLITLTGFYPPENKAVWIVMQGSSLTVNGSTNINTFQCDIANYNQPDTLTCLKNTPKGMVLAMSGKLNLSIEAFDCHNRMMTSDLRKTLKAKDFPILSVKFITLNGFPDFKNPTKITGLVDIGLAGVIKRFEINYLFSGDDKKQVYLKGDQRIHFSDFNLKPPSKLGGVIKAKDELLVEFKLNLKPIG
ncbi:MAG: YceI family protein [Sediminibacterium sp.]|nr:YceI family protein [Sediminibacterium sp.]